MQWYIGFTTEVISKSTFQVRLNTLRNDLDIFNVKLSLTPYAWFRIWFCIQESKAGAASSVTSFYDRHFNFCPLVHADKFAADVQRATLFCSRKKCRPLVSAEPFCLSTLFISPLIKKSDRVNPVFYHNKATMVHGHKSRGSMV